MIKRLLNKLLRKRSNPVTADSSHVEIHEGFNDAVLYQTWGLQGSALWYIDRGYQNAFNAAGHRWATWDPNSGPRILIETVKKLEPKYLLLNLQTIQRRAASWTGKPYLDELLRLKRSIGFKVACRSNPSNIAELFQQHEIDFSPFQENVRSFYQQPSHPDEDEREAFETGFIDIIRSAFFHGTYEIGFRNYLASGCKLVEEPHAADLVSYGCQANEHVDGRSFASDFDILFVGGCWPFKWKNMGPYVTALKRRFGSRFRVYGNKWPDGFSDGYLDEASFNETLQSAKINLTLHELSQTLNDPISGNERVFKLGALGCFCISDANPLIRYHFDVEREVGYCLSPDDMIEQCEFYLANPDIRQQRSKATMHRVFSEHSYQQRVHRIGLATQDSRQIVPYIDRCEESSGVTSEVAA